MFRSSHIFVFWFLVAWVHDFLSVFFPSCPSCLAKCKQKLRNIFVTSLPKVTKKPKTKNGTNETLITIFTLFSCLKKNHQTSTK